MNRFKTKQPLGVIWKVLRTTSICSVSIKQHKFFDKSFTNIWKLHKKNNHKHPNPHASDSKSCLFLLDESKLHHIPWEMEQSLYLIAMIIILRYWKNKNGPSVEIFISASHKSHSGKKK